MEKSTFPQAVTAHPGRHATFIVYKLLDVADMEEKIKDLCSNFAGLNRSIQNRFPDVEFSAVMGFGAEAWKRLFPEQQCPRELEAFKEIKGDKFVAVSTPGDLFFHIRSAEAGVNFEFAQIVDEKIKDVVESIDETHGFRYMDGKAIIGFVDGTENPGIDATREEFAGIGDEDPDFVGGSYAFVQKYIHKMNDWKALPVEEQEKVIGRHKFNDVELSDDEKPANAHNAVSNIGDDLKIVRGNMPFANTSTGEYGTYFIGYARYFTTTRQMLEHMFVGEPVGNTDRLLDYSTAITGTLFFIPSFSLLGDLGG